MLCLASAALFASSHAQSSSCTNLIAAVGSHPTGVPIYMTAPLTRFSRRRFHVLGVPCRLALQHRHSATDVSYLLAQGDVPVGDLPDKARIRVVEHDMEVLDGMDRLQDAPVPEPDDLPLVSIVSRVGEQTSTAGLTF